MHLTTVLIHPLFRAQAVLRYYWRRAGRIAPAFWVSLLLTHLLVLRVRDSPSVPEAAGALLHYPAAACPGVRLAYASAC